MFLSLIIITSVAMAIVSRMCGGGLTQLPSKGEQALWAALITLFSFNGLHALITFGFAFVSKVTGHGRGFHYDKPFKEGSKPEKIEAFIDLLEEATQSFSVKTRKILIMSLTGLGSTLGLGLGYVVYGYYLEALVVALGGLGKGLAYGITDDTEKSEYLTGAFVGASLGVVIWLLSV